MSLKATVRADTCRLHSLKQRVYPAKIDTWEMTRLPFWDAMVPWPIFRGELLLGILYVRCLEEEK